MTALASCPVCGHTDPISVFTLGDVPVVCNQLWPDEASAKAAPCGTVDLVRCPHCAMIWNSAFESERMVYAPGYENALHFSPKFQAFADDLARGLVKRFDLKGRDVVEIGCGDGHMLALMVKHGARSATGFDPSMAGKTSEFAERDGVEILPEYFRSDQLDRPFDAVLCRHVLEHLDRPMTLLTDIRRAIGDRDVPVYFEMPNAGWMLEALSMWDVIYEHVGYWTAPAMEAAFRRAGFAPVAVRTGYGGQFLMAEARPAVPETGFLPSAAKDVARAADSFAASVSAELERWRDRLGKVEGQAVVWGAGSKGTTFANALGTAAMPLSAFVDINPRKHRLYVPGVALPVLALEQLPRPFPRLIIISNSLYENEIKASVGKIDLAAAFEVVVG
jgi:SAM-dependent methyltransferase